LGEGVFESRLLLYVCEEDFVRINRAVDFQNRINGQPQFAVRFLNRYWWKPQIATYLIIALLSTDHLQIALHYLAPIPISRKLRLVIQLNVGNLNRNLRFGLGSFRPSTAICDSFLSSVSDDFSRNLRFQK
jgi:hypothetical protein